MDYYQKYLKYKAKYVNLKNQHGSGTELEKLKTDMSVKYIIKRGNSSLDNYRPEDPRSSIGTIMSVFQLLKDLYSDKKLQEEISLLSDGEKTALFENKNLKRIDSYVKKLLKLNILNKDNININLNPGLQNLLNILSDKVVKKICSHEEYMTVENPSQLCSNPELVIGSCINPSFFGNIHTINDNNEKIVEFFDLLIKANVEKKLVNIILGSRVPAGISNINVTFDPIQIHGNTLDYHIKSLKEGSISNIYHVQNSFPLNTDGTNKNVLDKILEMTTKFKVWIFNKMCGTCHRSLYYLVQNATRNFEYTVNPEQGLGSQDTEKIIECFKS